MAMVVFLHPGVTIQLNPAVCSAYNADFDGDEGNILVLQSPEARAEAWEKLRPARHCASIIDGSPLFLPVHDGMYHEGLNGKTKADFVTAFADLLPADVFTAIEAGQEAASSRYAREAFTVSLRDLPRATDFGDKALNEAQMLGVDTSFTRMIKCGARAKPFNYAQICCALGEQFLDGVCIGYISDCYVGGLSEDAFFMAARVARAACVQTTVGTAEAGYINRKAATCLENTPGGLVAALAIGAQITQSSLSNFKCEPGRLTQAIKDLQDVLDGYGKRKRDVTASLKDALAATKATLSPAHVTIIGDMLQRTGGLTRYGLQAGVFSRLMFEDQLKAVVAAAMRQETDDLTDLAARFLFGRFVIAS